MVAIVALRNSGSRRSYELVHLQPSRQEIRAAVNISATPAVKKKVFFHMKSDWLPAFYRWPKTGILSQTMMFS